MGYGTDGLTFNTLREGNVERIPEFKDANGRLCHPTVEDQPPGFDWTPAEWLQAVVGELGECANFMKKVHRGDLTPEAAHAEIAAELADTVTYLDILAHRLGIDLGSAIMEKWNRVSTRVGSKLYIDASGVHTRS